MIELFLNKEEINNNEKSEYPSVAVAVGEVTESHTFVGVLILIGKALV
jgi:hypothetical protein